MVLNPVIFHNKEITMNFNDILKGVLGAATNGSNQQGKSDLGNILNSVLGSVGSSANQGKSDLGGILNAVLGTVGQAKTGNTDAITKLGGGTALVGILSMVLGRNGGANLTKLGSLAALGSMAYKAYQDYQKAQSVAPSQDVAQSFAAETTDIGNAVILQAMIAAAYADGELDDSEQAILEKEAADNPALAELVSQPASVQEIAQNVGNNPALAAQAYLAARLVCQELSRQEIVFLNDLANALGLEPALVEQLEKQAGF